MSRLFFVSLTTFWVACGSQFVTLEGGFEPVQPKLDGSMFAYFRTVELEHTSTTRPLPFGERDVKWLHLRFLAVFLSQILIIVSQDLRRNQPLGMRVQKIDCLWT